MNVRSNILAGLLLMMLSVSAMGQIQVKIECSDYRFMMGEAIMARVVVKNDVHVPLVFNKSYHNAELEVSVRRDRASSRTPFVAKLDREFVIMPEESSTELVDVNSVLNMRAAGSYQVNAVVRYDGRLFTSQPKGIDVVSGVETASVRRSLKGYSNRILNYSLRYMTRNQREYLFLVIEDADGGFSYGTVRLGTLIRVIKPSLDFDDAGRIVVRHQSGREIFTRSVIDVSLDGAEFIEQTHHKRDGSTL